MCYTKFNSYSYSWDSCNSCCIPFDSDDETSTRPFFRHLTNLLRENHHIAAVRSP